MFFHCLQNERQAVVAFTAYPTHNYWNTRGPAGPSFTLTVYPELPVSGWLHDQHPGPRTPCGDTELWPRQAPEVPEAASVLKGSDEAFCLSLTSSRVSPHAKDFQALQSESEQHRGFFSQDGQRKRLQGQRPRGLAVWTDKDLNRHFDVGGPEGTLVDYLISNKFGGTCSVMKIKTMQRMLGLMMAREKNEDLFILMHWGLTSTCLRCLIFC